MVTAREVQEVARAAAAVAGVEVRANADPVGFSEEFAQFLQHRPGCFVPLGNGTDGVHGRSLHHPQYDFNDAAIRHGIDYGCQLVRGRLTRWHRCAATTCRGPRGPGVGRATHADRDR